MHFLNCQELADQALVKVVRMSLSLGPQCHLRVTGAMSRITTGIVTMAGSTVDHKP